MREPNKRTGNHIMRLNKPCLVWLILIAFNGVAFAQDSPPPVLTPQLAGRLAKLMKRDWKQPPEWAEEMVALLEGGGMGMGQGWFRPSQSRYNWDWLQQNFDRNEDSRVERDELPKSKSRDLLFARLDANRDGAVSAEDFRPAKQTEEAQLANELFYRLDVDSNGRLTQSELSRFFEKADRESRGFVTPDDVTTALAPEPLPKRINNTGGPQNRRRPSPADMIAMLLKGELGSLGTGPKLNAKAPAFRLRTFDDSKEVTLTQLLSKQKPIVLIFGSFT